MTFNLAKQLAFLATDLDESKSSMPPEVGARAFTCSLEMHQLALVLAGARVGEIYDQSEYLQCPAEAPCA